MEGTLEKIYYDAGNPGGLGGVSRLITAVKADEGITPKIAEVKTWLEKQDVYTLHAPAAIHFQRNRVYVSGIDKQFQADLVEMGEYSKENDGVRYLLTCIDVFSKYLWVRPLHNKTGASVTAAFKDILSDGRIPRKLQTDSGGEFFNKSFQQLMKDYGIEHFATSNETHASIVERVNRSLKNKMWRYLTSVNSRRYIPVLQQLVNAYNGSYHRSIKMCPAMVNKDNEHEVFNNLYKTKARDIIKFKYKVNDTVRISKNRGVFRKGYKQTFTDEFFKIIECVHRSPPVYKLQDTEGEPIQGTFYEKELQRVIVDKNKVFKIEKIIKKKKRAGIPMVFVKWLGWNEKFNSWIPENQIIDQV